MKSDSKKFRVALINIHHESNTFIPEPTTLDHFRQYVFLLGEEIREKYSHAHHEVSGFFQTLEEADVEAVPLIMAHAMPWGKVSDATLDVLWELIEDQLKKAGPLDGVLIAPHGAGVSESRTDMDGWLLGKVREEIGSLLPLIAVIDPHANLTQEMLLACNAITAYRENPHLDQRQRGIEAANLMVKTLHGDIRPVMAGALPRVAINIERQLTSAEPMLSLQRELEATRSIPGVLSASVALGFPYADVPEMGSAFIVITDNQPDLAQREAERLESWLIANRELFRGIMISPKDAFARVESAQKPVGLLDMGDNLGGGAPGDSTVLARLCEKSGQFRTIFFLADPESVKTALTAGIGARVLLKIGGKLASTPAPPIKTKVTVISIHDGRFTETKPIHGGRTGGDMGPTIVAKTDRGLTLMLSSNRIVTSGSAQPLLSCGINPCEFDIIILKGVHGPVGGFEEICPTLIRVNTPGMTSADMESLPYHHRRRPLFPFESI